MSSSGNEEPTQPPRDPFDPDVPTRPLPLNSPASPPRSASGSQPSLPSAFGRYRVVSHLGKGGFGTVYRAFDDQLERDVAIKVTLGSLLDPSMRQSFLTEARIVAKLDHPHIVPVHDVGQTDQGDFYVVSKLIEGSDLSDRIKSDRPNRILALRIVEQIADALHYAHSKMLVHRDVKPANILIDTSDRPYLTDFGLALRETEQLRKVDGAGTPAYMSPEQARGSGHRIDHRSDIYSLGVVLYELLTGRRPFRSENQFDLMNLIATEDVRSPRLFDDTISADLERLCLKALTRRASDRFTVARDFADEIRWLLDQPQSVTPAVRLSTVEPSASPTPVRHETPANPTPGANVTPRNVDATAPDTDSNRTGPTKIVPKGLRSFDASDASFFLDLLPGPFDREGLPESLRFWKSRIEETDPEKAFKVGLIYGPSGCGKSSLMKAGLLPRLSSKVISVYTEATPDDTELRLLRSIRKAIPDAEGGSLRDVLSNIRRHRLVPDRGKLLLILDQFEQWLFGQPDYAKASLTDALMQCDGTHVQAIVMVREDFWISVSRFLAELDIPIVERENSAMVDLFSVEHASKVLGLFGKAYGNLPDSSRDWTEDHRAFIRQAIEGLSQDKKVISVQIAVLADMMKLRNWSTATLQEVGGVEGVGVTFLEEMFGSRHAPIQHRQHAEAVRGLLASLLPARGTDIKGTMQSAAMLQKSAGYEHKPREFQSLLEILDKNLHLITPVDDGSANAARGSETEPNRRTIVPNRSEAESPVDTPERSRQSLYYQLAHDYLVPSLREWLTRKQRETKKGRAELKLAERAAVWSTNRENKQLPTLAEWFQIRYWTDRKRWKPAEQSLMRTAARVHAQNWGVSILVLALMAGTIGYVFQQQHLRSQQREITKVLDSNRITLGPGVPVFIKTLIDIKRPDLIRPELERRYAEAKESKEQLSLAFGLASFGRVEVDYLISQIDDIEDRDKANLIAALKNDRETSILKLRQAASECRSEALWKRKARLAITALSRGDTTLAIDACEFEGRTDHGARTWFIHEFPSWELDLGEVIERVANTESPALRSGISLAIGSIAADRVSPDIRERMSQVATKWYSLPDSSTHCAVAWLMREWGITEPKLPDANQMVEGRNWFVNSQGVTFVRITPKPCNPKPLTDPLEKYRQRLSKIDAMPVEEQNQPSRRYTRGELLYRIGRYESALSEFDALLQDASDAGLSINDRSEILKLRLFSLARLKRKAEAETALAEWLANESHPYYIDYVESLVPLWLGLKQSAQERLEKGWENAKSSGRENHYNLACAMALFAANEDTTAEEKHIYSDRALKLLERWSSGNYESRKMMRNDPDLIGLHSDPRFIKLAAERPKVPDTPYWIANREVTRGEFEAAAISKLPRGGGMMNVYDDGAMLRENADFHQSEELQMFLGRLNQYFDISPTEQHPEQKVSWSEAVEYCNWLSIQEGRTPAYRSVKKHEAHKNRDINKGDQWELLVGADGYRLPREVEWEYACRAGSETDWSTGNDSLLLAAYCQMIPAKLSSLCGQKLPNAWGMHDMHGNVEEYCWIAEDERDWYPSRGGGWRNSADQCQSASRDLSRQGLSPYEQGDLNCGFRVVLSSNRVPGQEAIECCSEELATESRLAITALSRGDTTLARDACEFEGRTDHGARTWFIHEFPSWKLNLREVIDTIANTDSPALRSGMCLAIGSIPTNRVTPDIKEHMSEVATKWFSLPDSSTHSAVAWLMREWGITEPKIPDANRIIDGRNWFVNSQGVTFVQITLPEIEKKPLTDPLEQVRKELTEMENSSPAEKSRASFRYRRGRNLFLIGQYEAALSYLDAALADFGSPVAETEFTRKRGRNEFLKLRLLALARLKRTEETDAALFQWMASGPSEAYRDYVESLVPLWLERKEAAIARLEQGLAGSDSANHIVLYNLARAAALFAAHESATEEEKGNWIDRSLTLLERCTFYDSKYASDVIRLNYDPRYLTQMREDPDLIALHSDPRFIELAAERPNVPEQPYWLANREVTRGEFEAFINDPSYSGETPQYRTPSERYNYEEASPTMDHPAQHVSWYDAVMYCNWLSRREGRTPAYRTAGKEKVKDYRDQEVEVDKWEQVEGANGYRLPREVEWEYACRAGSDTDWSTGSDESLLASYCQMSPSEFSSPSGQKLPNAWGLHDMHGNVREWCWDLYDSKGSLRVSRGGSWRDVAANCRSAYRDGYVPSIRGNYFGFRVALSSSSGIPKPPEAGQD